MGRQGVRATWQQVPARVRAAVDDVAGSPVVAARNLDGGFSPGPAARCELADGTVVFVKAAGPELNPDSPRFHRREARVLAALPRPFPAPRLIGTVDEPDGWVALVIEWIDGRMPTAPLRADDVAAALDAAEALSVAGHGVAPPGVGAFVDTSSIAAAHWGRIDTDGSAPALDGWAARHLRRLQRLEAAWRDALAGDTLVHGDLRTDNLLLTPAGAVVVDWPAAALGPPWLDLVGLLPALHLDGGPAPHDVFARHPVGRHADPAAVDVAVAWLAGFFVRHSLLPPPPGLPTVRAFQAAQGRITCEWLAARLAWE